MAASKMALRKREAEILAEGRKLGAQAGRAAKERAQAALSVMKQKSKESAKQYAATIAEQPLTDAILCKGGLLAGAYAHKNYAQYDSKIFIGALLLEGVCIVAATRPAVKKDLRNALRMSAAFASGVSARGLIARADEMLK